MRTARLAGVTGIGESWRACVLDGSDDHLVTGEPVSYASCGRRGGLCVFERGEAVEGTAGGLRSGLDAPRGWSVEAMRREESRRSEDARRRRSWALQCEESCQ
jgi:hypothetical protein